jgi:AcrR family transcriptional regulator
MSASDRSAVVEGPGARGPDGRRVRADALATRARIVATAESLFAEQGLEGVSLVEIGRAAGQKNRSGVQYHFGDKRGLVMAVLDKHTPGIEARRHAMLDVLEAEGRLELRPLVEALVWPVAEKLADRDGGIAFIRMNAELVGHPRHPLLALAPERTNRAADRLRRLTAEVTPRLPEAVWVPRWLMVTGLLFHGLADWSRQPPHRRPARDVFVNQLIDGIAAVLGAPLSPEARASLRSSPTRRR